MSNDLKLRLKSGVLALIVAGGISFASLPETKAEDIQVTVKQGSFIESIDEDNYIRYVVKEGDNTSIISKKICRYFGVEMTTKYWPVIAFLNDFPRIIKPGDIIVLPISIDESERMLENLKANNWTSRYIQKNNIYGPKKVKSRITVVDLIADIYGNIAYTEPNLVDDYLKILGLHEKYDSDTIITDNNELFELTDWIPTLEELGYSRKNQSK